MRSCQSEDLRNTKKVSTELLPLQRKGATSFLLCRLSSNLAQQDQHCSTWEPQPPPATTSTFSSKTGDVKLGLEAVHTKICILSEMMTPSPHSLTSSLQPLNPVTSHNNNNNNGRLLLVFVFLATYSPCSRVWVAAAVDLINDPNKRFWFLCTSHFHLLLVFGFSFYCLFVNSTQALCACSVSYSPFLANFKHHQ